MSTFTVQPNVLEFRKRNREGSTMSEPEMHPPEVDEVPPAVAAELVYQQSAELTKTNKKLVTVIMGMTLMLGLVASMAYLAGRSITAAKVHANGSNQSISTPQMPPPIIVDSPQVSLESASASAPAVNSAPAVSMDKQSPASIPTAAATPNGQLYLQVGYIDQTQVQNLITAMAGKGFTAKSIAGDTISKNRVIIGPIQLNEISAYQARLMDAGFESFPRRY